MNEWMNEFRKWLKSKVDICLYKPGGAAITIGICTTISTGQVLDSYLGFVRSHRHGMADTYREGNLKKQQRRTWEILCLWET